MRKLLAIGIGTGNPEHLTLQAVRALSGVDVVFLLDKGSEKSELSRLRRELCERYVAPRAYRVVELADPPRDPSIDSYEARVDAWHERRLLAYEASIGRELPEAACGAILVWGDPGLYDSTLRLLERMQARRNVAFEYEVIPGISSPQALAAGHRICLNRIGGAVLITTGRRLARAAPAPADDVLVMLDGECAFNTLPPDDYDVYWGAFLGTPDEILVSGPLREKAAEIERVRGAARAEHGWIMDTYLLRRRSPA